MPGEDTHAATRAALKFRDDGIGTLFTRLGENLTSDEEAHNAVASYVALIDELDRLGIDGEVSLKLTQLGLDFDTHRAADRLATIAAHAAPGGHIVWIDMESSAYLDATLEVFEAVQATTPNIGLCLQAYLRRTASDFRRLLPTAPSIRLVKGAYAERPSDAYQSSAEVDANYLAVSVMALLAIAQGQFGRFGLGTHDVRLIEQVANFARALGVPFSKFEVQMLYGIRLDQQRRLASEGFLVRDLISFGEGWYPWYLRRLAERPANVLFVLRQLMP